MKTLDVVAAGLVIVGALNWGLVGVAKFNLVTALFGNTILSSIVFTLVGLAGVYALAADQGDAAPVAPGARLNAANIRTDEIWTVRDRAGLQDGSLRTAGTPAEGACNVPRYEVVGTGGVGGDGRGWLRRLGVGGFDVTGSAGRRHRYAAAAEKDIVDTAVAAGKFKTLAAALEAAGLVDTLKGDGPFTVFAPTDEAFAKLPKGTVEGLLKPENKDKLKAILTYHVAGAKAMSTDLKDGQMVKTVNGKEVKVKISGENVMVGDAKVVKADIPAKNGVIHVIDTVLMP